MASVRVVFALTSLTKVQPRTFSKSKAEERIKKEKTGERILNRSRSMHGIVALRRNSVVVTYLSCLSTPRQKPARKVAVSTFQQFHHVRARLMNLRQVMCHLVFTQMINFGRTIELDPRGDKITCPALGLYSSPCEHSTMGHIVLDLPNLACQPTTKSCGHSGQPKRHLTFAMPER